LVDWIGEGEYVALFGGGGGDLGGVVDGSFLNKRKEKKNKDE